MNVTLSLVAKSLEKAPESVPMAVREQLDAMYLAHHVVIWRTLRRIGFSSEAAADSAQQAYLIAVDRLADIRAGSEKAFLFATAIKLAKTVERKLRRIDLVEDIEQQRAATIEDSATDRQMALQLLEKVLRPMESDLVHVFVLFEIPLGTVASRLRRARSAFREGAARLERQTRGNMLDVEGDQS
jgi:RNA polymerase sigma-70 factor, ECF subfamily